MKPRRTGSIFLLCVILVTFLLVLACHKPMANTELKSAMQTYDRLILKTDADSIAMLYTADGDLGNAVHGRDSIRNFLNRFKDYKVIEQTSVIDSIHITGDTGRISGTFHSVWINIPDYGWEIRKFETNTGK